MGEPARGRKPPVRRFGRVNAIGDGCAARQYGDPHEPAKLHRRKPFFASKDNRARRSAFTHCGVAPDFPSTQRFPDAGSYGKSGYTILLSGAGPHQPNLTGRVPFALQAFRRVCPDLKRHV
jgi:hypothetical protein